MKGGPSEGATRCLPAFQSVENYYQESGRAGRDGLPARCMLLYRFSDALRQAAIVCMEPSWQGNLGAIMDYAAMSRGCRRAALQRHFSEAPAECRCMCDLCSSAGGQHAGGSAGASSKAATHGSSSAPGSSNAPAAGSSSEQEDITTHAVVILASAAAAEASQKKLTLLQLIDAWRGAKDEPAVAKAAKAMSRDVNEALVAQLLYQGLLSIDFG